MATKTITKTNNVVQNNNTASVSYSREVFDTLAAINKQREQWEVGSYQKSNDELYAILQSCYAVDWAIAYAEEGANEMRKGITEYAAKLGFSFKEGTPTMNKIVRCVFGNVKRSRISTYALVSLRAEKEMPNQALSMPRCNTGRPSGPEHGQDSGRGKTLSCTARGFQRMRPSCPRAALSRRLRLRSHGAPKAPSVARPRAACLQQSASYTAA